MNQPNILFILSDDQGAWAMRCAGNVSATAQTASPMSSQPIFS